MRAFRTVDLDTTSHVTVHELRVRDVRDLLIQFDKGGSLYEVSFAQMFTTHFANVIELLKPCFDLPANRSFDDLSLSELQKIWDAFKEVNNTFFVQQIVQNLSLLSGLTSKN